LIHVRDSSDGKRRKPKAKNAKKQLREEKSHSIEIDIQSLRNAADSEARNGTITMMTTLHTISHLSCSFDWHYITIRENVNSKQPC